ncbi:MAG: Nif11-like leader peptide family RiPP precursor [Oscillospiraceae bacterium]|nr:Nif11-like leader peptide family RiPP precursor [Oscillospiraceae bacterium]
MNRDELRSLFNDENFQYELSQVSSSEELKKLLGSKGIEISVEDIENAIKSDEELSETELSNVSGGGIENRWARAWRHLIFILMSVVDKREIGVDDIRYLT